MEAEKDSIPRHVFKEVVSEFEELVHDLGLVIETGDQNYRDVIKDIDSLTRHLEEITREYYMHESHKKVTEMRKEEVEKMFDSLLG